MGVTKKIMSQGDGKTYPARGDEVTVHYVGTLAGSGKKIDSSVDTGRPFKFRAGLGQVIRGLDTEILNMSLGEKSLLNIPSVLAYGESGTGEIPPHADLVYEVELLSIESK
eukprot:Sspe_Gene.73136::Locus_43945_Transcript_1_1_Confidence_1.000_Length_503::g.73136::m.73136/K09568/FKBP1; FK506-binding protein 1